MTYEAASSAYLQALRLGDRDGALQMLRDMQRHGVPLRTIYLSVVAPALTAIGRLWQSNELSVAEEHLATAITQSAIAGLYDQTFAAAKRRNGRRMIGACTANEWHEIGLRMFCDLAELEGWEALHLGAAVPCESLVAMIRVRRPDVVALSVAISEHVESLAHTIQSLRQASGANPLLIVIGGQAVRQDPGLAQMLGADYAAADAGKAIDWLRRQFHERD